MDRARQAPACRLTGLHQAALAQLARAAPSSARNGCAAVARATAAAKVPRRGVTTMNALIDTAINPFVRILGRSSLLAGDLDYHIVRASMVIIFFFFVYQKWWPYEAERLVPFISNGPLIWWLYPLFGHQGASWFLGVSEWTFGALLLAGFWDKRLGILGAAGSTATFIATVTIIPFMPDGWDPVAGFPAMTGNVPFLMKDVVLLAVSLYLLRQDVVRVTQV